MKAAFLDYATVDAGDLDRTELAGTVEELLIHDFTSPEARVDRLAGMDAALINKIRLGDEEFAALPDLRYVGLVATGTDNVDLAAAARHGVTVTNIRDYCTPSVAQHAMALILTLSRRLDRYRELVREGAWRAPRPFCLLDLPIRDLSDMTLGLVGYGVLARGLESLAQAFGMTVLKSQRPGGAAAAGRVPFNELLGRCDVLSLHCPLTEHTRGLIDTRALSRMRSDAILINTGRGGLVDSAALADALRRGELGGAGIDVLPAEPPPPDEPLLASDIPNLVLTPHVAWASHSARQKALDEVTQNLRAFVRGERRCVVT